MNNPDTHYATPESTEEYARGMDFQIAEYDDELRECKDRLVALVSAFANQDVDAVDDAIVAAEAFLEKYDTTPPPGD